MYKRDDKSRFLVLYGCVLMILGLGVLLITSKITNKKITANSQIVMENALKGIEENESLMLKNMVYSDEVSKGYKQIRINKVDVNEQINNKKLSLLLVAKNYIDHNGNLKFNSGEFTDEEMVEFIVNLNKKDSLTQEQVLENSDAIFNSKLNYDKSLIDNVEVNEIGNICILKVNKVFRGKYGFDIFIDEVYPENPELYDMYNEPKFIDYSDEEVVSTYKLKVDNNYKYVSLDKYTF